MKSYIESKGNPQSKASPRSLIRKRVEGSRNKAIDLEDESYKGANSNREKIITDSTEVERTKEELKFFTVKLVKILKALLKSPQAVL